VRFLEFALSQLIDNKLILFNFDKKFHNDETGVPAYDPRIHLKIILFAYSRGITSSREIARCCEQNIVFMALSAHRCPHFTTIATFISSMDKEIITFFPPSSKHRKVPVALATCATNASLSRAHRDSSGCLLSGTISQGP
jgi:Transposase domain (DUF772)